MNLKKYLSATLLFIGIVALNAQNLLDEKITSLDSEKVIKNDELKIWWEKDKEKYLSINTDDPYNGTGCLNAPSYGENKFRSVAFYTKKGIIIEKGDNATGSVYAKADVPCKAVITLYSRNANDVKVLKSKNILLTVFWQQFDISGMTEETSEGLVLTVRAQAPFLIDEVKIERGKTATPSIQEKKNIDPASAEPFFTVNYTPASPVIDGKIDEACWLNASPLKKFLMPGGKDAFESTDVRMLFDDKYLYLACRFELKNNRGAVALTKFSDVPEWADDRVEFFINAAGASHSPVFYISTSSNAVSMEKILCAGEWKPALNIKTSLKPDAWTMEMALPIKELGLSSLNNIFIPLNIVRIHGSTKKISYSCLAGYDNLWNKHNSFKNFYFNRTENPNGLTVKNLSRGRFSKFGFVSGTNEAIFIIENKSQENHKIKIQAKDILDTKEENSIDEEFLVPPGKICKSIYYKLSDTNGRLSFNVIQEPSLTEDIFSFFSIPLKTELFKLDCDIPRLSSEKMRVYKTPDPIFEPLLNSKMTKPENVTNIIWTRLFADEKAYDASLQTATAYSRETLLSQTGKAGLHPLLEGIIEEKDKMSVKGYLTKYINKFEKDWNIFKKTGNKAVLHANYSILGHDGNREGTSHDGISGWPADPINTEAYYANVIAHLKTHRKDICAVFIGDELSSNFSRWGLMCFEKYWEKKPTEYMKQCYDEVKNKYGFGKFTIPFNISKNAPEYPFCKRAFTQWSVDRIAQIGSTLRKKIHKTAPEIKIVSDDCVGGIPIDLETWAAYVDIGTFQQNSGIDEVDTESAMYKTKLVKDISGVKSLLVVPHQVSDCWKDGAKSPEELCELYSQLIRGGMDGVHFWPGAYTSAVPYAVWTGAGYPYTWEKMLQMSKFLTEMPPLKFPEYNDVAILRVNDSVYSGENGHDFGVFTQIGQNSRGWFKFISDRLLFEDRVNMESFKLIYATNLKYSRIELAEKILAFIENGGIFVCSDPAAFEYAIDGNSMSSYRQKIFGVKMNGEKKESQDIIFPEGNRFGIKKLKVQSPSFGMELEKGVDTIASFADNTPAVSMKKIGKGKAFFFATQAFAEYTLTDKDWILFSKNFYIANGGKAPFDIWRFKLPEHFFPPLSDNYGEVRDAKCLTGNFGFWDRFIFTRGDRFNIKTNGSYEIIEENSRKIYPFNKGVLTNRLDVLSSTNVPAAQGNNTFSKNFKRSDWVEEFDGKKDVKIIFNLAKKFKLKKLRLLCGGIVPSMSVFVSADGKTWDRCREVSSFKTKQNETINSEIDLNENSEAQYIKILLDKSPAPYMIVETEIWGNEE